MRSTSAPDRPNRRRCRRVTRNHHPRRSNRKIGGVQTLEDSQLGGQVVLHGGVAVQVIRRQVQQGGSSRMKCLTHILELEA